MCMSMSIYIYTHVLNFSYQHVNNSIYGCVSISVYMCVRLVAQLLVYMHVCMNRPKCPGLYIHQIARQVYMQKRLHRYIGYIYIYV